MDYLSGQGHCADLPRSCTGIHTDTAGNVYSGVGDGVAVWNPEGVLIGKFAVANGGGKSTPFEIMSLICAC